MGAEQFFFLNRLVTQVVRFIVCAQTYEDT